MTPECPRPTTLDGVGFVRDERCPGIRNHVLVLPSVICSSVVAETVAEQVPEAVCAPHDHGCGQIGADEAQTRRTLRNVCQNPNVAGVVVIGLGCETISSESLAASLDVPVRQTAIQAVGGTEDAIATGRDAARELAAKARTSDRGALDLGELTLGLTVSDLTESTVERVAPETGELVRSIVDAGGRVVVAEVEALIPHAEAASDLTADPETASSLKTILSNRREQSTPTDLRRAGAEYSPAALATLWGEIPIVETLRYGEQATHDSGIALVAASDGFEERATALAAAGVHAVVHCTADGVPTGHPIVPVIKATGDHETATALPDDIDVDTTMEDDSLDETVAHVMGGRLSAAEEHGLYAFAIARAGPSL